MQAIKEFSKSRLRKRAQSNILRQGPHRFPHRGGRPNPDSPVGAVPHIGSLRARESSDALYLIREEMAIMMKLNHPNLVQLIEVLDDPEEDSLYMVMEMCKKGVIMKVGLESQANPYSEDECRCWFRDLILGIEYCESRKEPCALVQRAVGLTEPSTRAGSYPQRHQARQPTHLKRRRAQGCRFRCLRDVWGNRKHEDN